VLELFVALVGGLIGFVLGVRAARMDRERRK